MKWNWVLHFSPALFLVANLGCQSAGSGNSTRHTNQGDPEKSNDIVGANLTKAENGDPEAQNYIGNYYSKTGKDNVVAVEFLSRSAAQGNEKAKQRLTEIEQIPVDRVKLSDEFEAKAKKSFEEIKTKAENGDAVAQTELGFAYRDGYSNVIVINFTEAFKWYSKAAQQGFATAQASLGCCYAHGEGVVQDYAEAVKWYRRAADKGDAYAQFCLGICNDNGQGTAQDHTEAAKWYHKAAEQNYAQAQSSLGALYGIGEGVPKDFVEAYKWRLLAAAQGDDFSEKAVIVLESVMTREQVAEGQNLARNFKPHKEFGANNSTSPGNPSFTGTGFFITDDGYLISNYHVVKDAAKVRLVTGAGLINATVVKVDAANDLALLKATGWFAPLPVAPSRGVKLGGTVATIGFPDIGLQGFSPKLSKGEIASLSGAADDPRYFQISVPVQPGNSGGALVDVHGNVVGIVAAKLSAQAALDATGSLPENVNYAVKSSLLLSFLESVPAVSAKLKEPITSDRKFEDMVKSAQDAAVLVLVY